MPVTEESIIIDKPVDEVFAFFAAAENAPVYMTNVMDYELVSGEGGKEGSLARATVKVAGRKIELTEELARVEPGRAQHRRSVKSPIRYETVFRFDPVETGTRVTFRQDTEEVGSFFVKFTQPVVEKLYARDVRNNLEHAKQLLEEGDADEG
ncbi:SRPBCC family protein [Rhodococcus sp. NPDC047139]|uniref:SRPBCC family protein n=1 Tax=Rhodococcus sp. NPDC047139 TaxID=3155141 RepID=UPI0034108458